MVTKYDFRQGQLLQAVADPDVRGGVCVALCDFWLHSVRTEQLQPAVRLQRLAARFAEVIAHQKQYKLKRRQHGPLAARQQLGQSMGLDFDQQTTVLPALIGLRGVQERMARDLRQLGNAATWSLRWINIKGKDVGHAMAGYSGLESILSNMHRQQISIFDPNIGEYVCQVNEMEAVFRDIFRLVPAYAGIYEVRRVSVQDLEASP
jgi:hypothetical protein